MKPNEIVKDIMKFRGFSNASLATKLGKSTASAVSNPLSRENGMRIDTFLEMIDAMGCEIVVRDKMGSEQEWVIDIVSEPKYPMPDEVKQETVETQNQTTPPTTEKKSSGKRIKLPKLDLDALLVDDEPVEPTKPVRESHRIKLV